ncbi:thioredoxin family protein [Pedobacter faecalis]|uniref:thioredoxin family protein n=1 Tax=Pedobacter faecalis TaxID=3041495 RepID=UPI002551149B|nr:thioredoxin family protein [Pedobacter sp. ELA7]
MTFQQYLEYFQGILNDPNAPAPYNNIDYLDYTKMNWARQNRWLKTGVLSLPLADKVAAIDKPQNWIVITEPWCGDASHLVPFIHKLSELNPLISIDYQLRDSEPFLIEQYLTNGGKAIPKFIIRDESDADLMNWGPRPAPCQQLYLRLKEENLDFNTMKIELQKWYNEDKGQTFQSELLESLTSFAEVSG